MPLESPGNSGHDAAPTMTTPSSRNLAIAATALTALLVVSGIAPFDRITWLMEVAPVLIALPLMAATHRRFPLTTLLYMLIFVHAVVLIAGGAYSYARVPLGFWIADVLGVDRNPYDKIGHFMQGFVPAIVAREIFLRGAHVQGRRMLAFLSICVVMMVSSCYELIEWAAAVALGQGADEFLGTQGYAWDTQSDMFLALLGACTALLLLSGRHDRQLAVLRE
jgi:putative membrane protein